MKTPGVPELVDPTKSCDKCLSYEGTVSAEKLPRFAEPQSAGVGELNAVEVRFSFHRDEQNLRVAEVSYRTVARLACERCLGEVDYPISGDVTLAFAEGEEQLGEFPRSYEPVLVEGHEVNLYQALEDELLLSLPMFAYHEDEHCNSELNEIRSKAEEPKTENPFAVLGELLKK